jgi:hypothetical protein
VKSSDDHDTNHISNSSSDEEYILNHAVERKHMNDLVTSINTQNKTTGFVRNDFQRLKMKYSGVPKIFYLVQGEIQHIKSRKIRYDTTTKMRVHRHKKSMEADGFVVVEFGCDEITSVTHFLQTHHPHMQALLSREPPTGNNYTSMLDMNLRAKWVTKLGEARKGLDIKISLGEKRMRLILDAFPTELAFQSAFHHECRRDVVLFLDRLVALNPDARKGLSRKVAQSLCVILIPVSAEEIETAEATRTRRKNPKRRRKEKNSNVMMVTPHSNDDDENLGETLSTTSDTNAGNSAAKRRLFVDG